MATEAYDVVRSLRELLQSGERREQSRVETALAGMQFAQQKKMQDVQLAGQQLQFLQTVNAQQKQSAAIGFINDSGLGLLYSAAEDEEDKTKAVENAFSELTKPPKIKKGVNKGGYGFSGNDANRIIGAIWASKAGSHDEILSIANELNTKLTSPGELSKEDNQFLKGFVQTGYISPQEYEYRFQESGKLQSLSKVVQNSADIAAEMYEYGTGEFEIQRDIKMFEPEDVGMDWQSAISEFEKSGSSMRPTTTDISPQIAEIETLKKSVATKEQDMSLIELEIQNLQELSQANLITDSQQDRLDSIPLQIQRYEEEIEDLASKINSRKQDLSITSALAVKEAFQETGSETAADWSSEYDMKELSTLLSKYHGKISEDVLAGKAGAIFKESMVVGGKLKGAPISDKMQLWGLAKKIDESRTLGSIKTAFQEKIGMDNPYAPGYKKEGWSMKMMNPQVWASMKLLNK